MQDQNVDKQTDDISSVEPKSVNIECQKSDIAVQNTMSNSCSCGSSGKMFPTSYIYAIGKVVHRFPTKSVELELKQATGRKAEEETKGLVDEEVLHNILSDPANRYIARQMCYVLNIEKLETYILVPTDPLDLERLAQALRPSASLMDIDVIIGRRGPIASPEVCNGLLIPIVMVDQIYSFDRDALMKAIPKREGTDEGQFKKTAEALFSHIVQIADNAGATDEHRALNYLSVRYDEIYHRTQLMQDENYSFTGVDVRPSRLSVTRKVVDVIFTYENRTNRAVHKWFVRVDVTEEFPFLVSHMQQYFER